MIEVPYSIQVIMKSRPFLFPDMLITLVCFDSQANFYKSQKLNVHYTLLSTQQQYFLKEAIKKI